MAVNYAVEATTSLFVAGISIIILLLCSWILPPQYPRNIPSVPFWVSLLPLFGEVDQEVNYHRYIQKKLQKHGAIKIFFGGQWNLLVQRSSYLREILKDEDTYHKSGNQKKIPRSLLAAFLGKTNSLISWNGFWALINPCSRRQCHIVSRCGLEALPRHREAGFAAKLRGVTTCIERKGTLLSLESIPRADFTR